MGVWSLGQEEPLEKEMATHSSIPAKIISWTEEPGRLWSLGSQTVGHCVTVTKQQQSEQQWLNNSDNTGTHWLIHWWWRTGSGLLPSGTLEPPQPAPSPPPFLLRSGNSQVCGLGGIHPDQSEPFAHWILWSSSEHMDPAREKPSALSGSMTEEREDSSSWI